MNALTTLPRRVSYRCKGCGSPLVQRDASVIWDTMGQKWILGPIHNTAECLDCDTETTLEEVEIQG